MTMQIVVALTVASALYAVPGGRVEVASIGLVEIATDDGPAMTAWHVRVVLTASADLPLAFDATHVTLDVGTAHERPTLATSDLATLPLAILDPGESAALDLFYAVPPGEQVDAPQTPDQRVSSASHWWFDPTYAWPRFRHADGILVPQPPSSAQILRVRG